MSINFIDFKISQTKRNKVKYIISLAKNKSFMGQDINEI